MESGNGKWKVENVEWRMESVEWGSTFDYSAFCLSLRTTFTRGLSKLAFLQTIRPLIGKTRKMAVFYDFAAFGIYVYQN